MYAILNELRTRDQIRFEQYMALDIHLANLVDLLGGCERIANTGMPSAFGFFVKQALLFYALIFPFGWMEEFSYLIIPMILMIVYILLGLEILAEELEDPFGTDENDLPLDALSDTIVRNLTAIGKSRS
jgi:putative membrane protein